MDIMTLVTSIEFVILVALGIYFKFEHGRIQLRMKQDELRIKEQETRAAERELEGILAIKCLLRVAELTSVMARLMNKEDVNGDLERAQQQVSGIKQAYKELLKLKGLEGMEEFR